MAKNPFEDPKYGTNNSNADGQGGQPQRKNVFEDDSYGKDPGIVRSVADTGVSAAQGLVRGAEMLSSAVDASSGVSKRLRDVDEYIGGFKSGGRRAEQDARGARIQQAEESGSTWEEIKAYAGAFAEAPIDTTVESLGTMAPAIAANVVTRGRAGPVTGGAISGAQGAGATKGSIYESVKNEHLQAGATPEEAEARAAEAQAYSGDNVDQIGVGAGLGVLAGSTGVERAAGRLAHRLPGGASGQNPPGLIGHTARGVAKELPAEAAQGGHEQLAGNIALQREGFDQPLWQGVAGSATLEGLAGGAAGGGFGLAEGFASRRQRGEQGAENEPDVVPPQASPDDPAPAPAAEAPVQQAPAPEEAAPQWTSPGQVSDQYRTETPIEREPRPSEKMGLDPNAGPISEAASLAVDSGVTQQLNPGAAPDIVDQTGFLQGTMVDQQTGEVFGLPSDERPSQPANEPAPTPEAQRADAERRLNVLSQQAKAQGWTPAMIAERNRAQQELEALAPSQATEAVERAATEAATSPANALPEPTEAQKEAGNYKKGHVRVQGLDVSIENPRGSIRKGKRPDGSEWQHEMSDHYGYIRRTKGADSEQVDVYVGPNPDASNVFVVDQLDQETGQFDEHKVMMGYPTQQAAVVAYKSNFDPNWKVGPVRPMSVDEFKGWLKDGNTAAPASEAPAAPAPAPTAEQAPASDGQPDIQAITRKQIPDMTDAEIEAAIAHYGPGHKRTNKLQREQAKRRREAPAPSLAPEQPAQTSEQPYVDKAVADAAGYEQRTNDRIERIKRSNDPDEIYQIMVEHGQDDAGHPEGYSRVQQIAKNRRDQIENPPEPGIVETSGSERQAQGIAEKLTRDNPGKSYRVERRQDGWGEHYAVIDNDLNPPKQSSPTPSDTAEGSEQQAAPEKPRNLKEGIELARKKKAAEKAAGQQPNAVPVEDARLNEKLSQAREPAEAPAPTSSPEKAKKLDDASAKLSEAKKKAALELKALLDSRRGTLNMGVDPEVMLAVAKVGALTVADGTVKFAVWVRDVISTTRAVGIDDEQVKPFLKEAYGAIASNPEKYDISDDLADAMDAPRDIRRMDIDGIVNEMPQDEGVSANEQQADSAGSSPDSPQAQGAGSGRGNDTQQGSAPVDSGQLEAEQSENVGEPAGGQGGGRSGVRSPAGDVSGAGQAGSAGDAGKRRKAGSGARGSASGSRGGRGKPEVIKAYDVDLSTEEKQREFFDALQPGDRIAFGDEVFTVEDKPARLAIRATRESDGESGIPLFATSFTPEGFKTQMENNAWKMRIDPSPRSPAAPSVGNFHIDDPKSIVGGGQVSRFKKNQAAIEVYNTIRDESRQATRAEQETLAGYTGWGSFGQELFQGSWTHPQPKAGWEARDKWLRDHLGEDEWKGLQRSIINAHYTDPPTVQAMWGMVERMGFKGGRVLEPSMGIGNFFGLMPPKLKNRSQLAGVELDPVTGGMAKLLYPDANVSVMGYQDSKTPDNFYDVIIGNWPFENSPIADRRYNRLNPFVHDYFFLKAMDQVRPGGIVMAITSAGSMDKKNTTIRRELAKKGELIGAFRLPSGAFEEYAGTKVVTDIIILRKRPEPVMDVSGESWIQVAEVDTPAGQKITVNEYYANNPDKVLGTLNFGHGSTYGRPSMVVDRPADLEARLQQAVESLPEGAYLKSTRSETISFITNHTDDREGAITVSDDKLFIVRGEYLAPAEEVASWAVKDAKKTQAREQQIRDAIGLRKLYAELLDAEVRQEGADAARNAMNDAYTAFTKAHGNLSDSFALKYMKKVQDPFYHSLAALEVDQDGKRVPATILTRSTMRRKPPIKNPSIQDAFILARGTSVNPSMDEVAEMAGTDVETTRKTLVDSGAVFELPGGDTEPSDLYLSGNVRVKHRQAKQALEMGNASMERNVKALEAVLPPTVPYYNIEVQLGATWIPSRVYEQFVAHMLNEQDTKGISATFTNGLWKVRLDPKLGGKREAETGFGTKHYPFRQLVNAAISNQVVTIKKTIDDGGSKTTVVDYEASDAANNKIREMRETFGDWLWQDQQRRMELEEEYNETRNAYAEPRYDGSFMPFDGMALQLGENDFNLRKHQVNAIWRGLVTRRSLNAHEVGTGKSFTIAGIAVESRRYGIARKPLILGHNANSKSVAADITAMYPSAKVLYIDNLQPSVIDTKLRQIANDDWDAVVIPHSLLGRLSFKEDTLMAMAQEEIEGLEAEARLAAEEDGVSFNDDMLDDEEALKKLRSPTAKDLVKTRNRIIESIKKQSQRSSKPGAVAFEDLGVDMVLVDEAHEFKKPPFRTKMRMKGLQTATSDKAIALKFVTDYIRMSNNGGNVHLFTGTPITNTLTEVFHQMRYIMAEEMRDIGVDQWDGWFGSFAKEVDDVELDGAGNYETVTRLRGFVNVPELRKMIGQYMDVVFANDMPEMKPRRTKSGKTMADELTEAERQELFGGYTKGAADRPYKKVITDNADLTPEQNEVFSYVRKMAREFKEAQGKQRMEWMRSGDAHSPIIYEGVANRASFDVRLVQDEKLAGMEGKVPDDPNSKISRAIKNIKEIYNGDKRATQVVFTDTGLGTTAERTVRDASGNRVVDGDGKSVKRRVKVFSPMRDMVERLVQDGIPRNEIAIVDGSTSKDKRKAIADAMNASQIRVVIGSSSSLGVGVNMQRNLRAMHHLDAPYMPGDLEQRNGRGHRQGNQWNTVLEFRYTTDKLDGRRWQILAIKQKFIQDFLKADNSVRVLEGEAAADEESDILQTFSEASGDPRVLLKVKMEKDLEQLQKKERLFYQGLIEGRKQIKEVEQDIERGTNRLAKVAEVNAVDVARKALDDMRGQAFTMEIDGKAFTERDPATEALLNLYKRKIHNDNRSEVLARYGNVDVVGKYTFWKDTVDLELDINGVRFNVNTPTIRGIESALRGIPDGLDEVRTSISNQQSTLARLREDQKQTFPRADKLEKVKKAAEDLERDMRENPEPPPSWLRQGAPTETTVFHNGNEVTVTGHRWNDRGWFVLAEDKDGASLEIPYLDAKDNQGMPVYDERPFQKPEPPAKTDKERAQEQKKEPEAGQGDERYRRTSTYRGAGMSAVQARGVVSSLMRDWKDRPGVTVAESIDQFPAELAQKIRDAGAEGDMRAVFWRDNVYVLAPRIPSRKALEEVILHEVVGHYGLRKLLGKELTPFLTRVYKDMGRSERAEEIKGSYFPDNTFDERNLKHRLTVAEELIAHMAESGKHRDPALWQRIVAAIRNGLRRLGFKIRITDRDILAILRGAQRTVENGGIARPHGAELAFRRAYHGTPHKFDRFSLDAIGTGEGVQAFGWGLYFAGRREVAEFYRTSLSAANVTFDDLKPAKKGTAAEKFVRYVESGNLYLTREQVAEIIGEARARTAESYGELKYDGDGEVDAIHLFAMEFGAMDVIYRGDDQAYVLRDGSVLVEEANGEFYAANTEAGNLYQVDIPDDNKLLDWNKRLDDQPAGITGAVRAVTDEYHGKGTFDAWMASVEDGGDYREWSDNLMEEMEASEISKRLAAKGVPGLRYLDGDSRIDAADRTSHNYVIWDEGVVTLEAVNDEIEQAETMFSRGGTSSVYALSLNESVQRVKELMPKVNAAYEAGNLEVAAELDAELDALFDRLEDGASEAQEDGPMNLAGAIRDLDLVKTLVRANPGSEEDAESGLEEVLASTWSDYIQGYGAMERENVVANGRANIENLGGDTSKVSDQQILDVMQDAYENTGQRRAAKRKPKGNFGRRIESADDIRFSLASKPSLLRRGVASAAVGKTISRQLKGKLSDLKPAGLGALPLMYLRDFAPKSMTALDRYLDEKRAMDADRNEMHTRYDAIAQRWLKERFKEGGLKEKAKTLAGLRSKEVAALDSLMHDATIAGIDPSLETMPKGADRAQWGMLKARFNKLPQSQKKLFVEVRNAYRDQIKSMEDAIQANIAKSAEFAKRRAAREFQAEINRAKDELTGREQDQAIEDARERYQKRVASADSGRTSRVMMLREKFESMRVEQPYFPLKRFGDYFVALRDSDGNLQSFSMFEKAADMEAAAEELARLHPSMDVTTGRKSNKEELQNAIDPSFVADIQELLSDEVGDPALTDAIYQMYLETLPDFSMRKSFIHRKKVPGYHQDAMRAFASTMFHSSHQIARLKHKLEMDELVEIAEEQASEAKDPADAMTIANELRRRHEWVMNPQGSKQAQAITSAAFVYQLGITPAAALVNTTQTFMLGIPVLGTRFKSEAGATKELLRASKDFISGKGHIENSLKGEEKAAFDEFMRLGLIDKTQAHDLAGVGETGVEYSAVRHKVMGAISYLFHNAERYNREVTAMAAYRMGRESGMGHQEAVKEAADLTWTVHFDYSSGNRARYMQSDTAKVLLVFRQHSINMLARLAIDMRQAMKGESKEVRREAWRRLAGIYGMFALGAGMLGVPGARAFLILLDAMDDDDDPWTAEDKIKRAVTEALGEDLAAAFFHGVPGTLADLNLTDRIGMGHLWFFSPHREMEGRDAYYYWMEQLLGAAPAMVANTFSGLHMMSEGHTARGIETMLPKAGKDVMRAVRYSNEGVQSMNGYSVVDEVSAWGVVAQAIGFMPAHVVEGYERNSAVKGAEQRILGERRNILNRYALAVRTNDDDARLKLQGQISEFNRKYPSVAITFDTIRNSLQRRSEGRARAEGGVLIDKRLNYLRRELAPE